VTVGALWLVPGVIVLVLGAGLAADVGGSASKWERAAWRMPGPGTPSPGRWVGVCLFGIGVLLTLGGVSKLG
jgi:hypothetical protein